MKIECWRSPTHYRFELVLENEDDAKYIEDSAHCEELGKLMQRAALYTINYYGIHMPEEVENDED